MKPDLKQKDPSKNRQTNKQKQTSKQILYPVILIFKFQTHEAILQLYKRYDFVMLIFLWY